jgi:hypothetical protein
VERLPQSNCGAQGFSNASLDSVVLSEVNERGRVYSHSHSGIAPDLIGTSKSRQQLRVLANPSRHLAHNEGVFKLLLCGPATSLYQRAWRTEAHKVSRHLVEGLHSSGLEQGCAHKVF